MIVTRLRVDLTSSDSPGYRYAMKLSDNPGPAYAKVEATIRAAVATGELLPGEQIPAGPKLAKDFGVALMTVRKAIDRLKAEGVLQSSHGVGVFVASGTAPENDMEALRREMAELRDRVANLERLAKPSPEG